MSRRLLGALFCACLFHAAQVSHAALITGTIETNPSLTIDLAALGTSDWAYWGNTSGSAISGTPSNEKSGADLIGSASIIGTGNLRGSTTLAQGSFAFSGGTSAATSPQTIPGIFSSQLNTAGTGVGLGITLPDLQTYEVRLWVAGFNAVGNLTASMAGATTYTDNSITYAGTQTGNLKDLTLYTFVVTPDTANSLLQFNFTQSNPTNASSHVLIAAAAVSPVAVPEPGTWMALGSIAAGGLFFSYRRRS